MVDIDAKAKHCWPFPYVCLMFDMLHSFFLVFSIALHALHIAIQEGRMFIKSVSISSLRSACCRSWIEDTGSLNRFFCFFHMICLLPSYYWLCCLLTFSFSLLLNCRYYVLISWSNSSLSSHMSVGLSELSALMLNMSVVLCVLPLWSNIWVFRCKAFEFF